MNTDETTKPVSSSAQKDITSSHTEFEDLIPTNKADFSNYEDALDHAFNTPQLCNIAITGPYGAGKSSILNSYLSSHEQLKKKSIRISLAHFQPTSFKLSGKAEINGPEFKESTQKETDKSNKSMSPIDPYSENLEQLLEGKILNQLIHKLPEEVVRNAGFHSIDYKKSSYFSLFMTSIISLFLACLFVPFIYIHFAPTSLYLFLAAFKDSIFIILMSLFILLSSLIVFTVYKYSESIRRKIDRIHHLKVQGNEIELFQSENDPYFDKYLDSIIYMLHHADIEFYIFEDIDRFDITLIFERLKEINDLSNAKEHNCSGNNSNHVKSIKFIYLLRDDMFINKERAKFFDFIIPIIPITNTNNSADRLMSILTKYGINSDINTDLVMALGFFIEDFRLVKNIANEFKIYYYTIKESNKLDTNKLLAIITYKNLFPKDFSELQKHQGYVHFLLSNNGKTLFIEKLIESLNKHKKQLEDKVASIENEVLNSKREIACAVLGNNQSRIWINSSVPLADLENEIDHLGTYAKQQYNQRVKLLEEVLEDKKNGTDSKLKLDIEKIEYQINILKPASFHELAIKNPAITDEIFHANEKDNNNSEISFDPIRRNEYFNLLKYLLINGYIDESYGNYTTYFYGEFLSENDQQFIMNVHNNGAPKWKLPLTNCIQIIKNISVAEFSRPCVLNFDLISQMLVLYHNNREIKELRDFNDKITGMFTNFHDQYFLYAIKYLNESEHISAFSVFLLQTFPGIFSALNRNEDLKPAQLERLTYSILLELSKDELITQNSESGNQLTEYISNNPNFLKGASGFSEKQLNQLVQYFINLNIKFKSIDANGVSNKLLSDVFRYDLFEINGTNLYLFFTQVLQNDKQTSVTKPLSLLLQLNQDDETRNYLEHDWEHFIQGTIENLKKFNLLHFSDESPIIAEFINSEDPDIDLKIRYLEHLEKETIARLTEIDNETISSDVPGNFANIWQFLIDKNLVQHSDENLYAYIKNNNGINNTLVETLNDYFANSPLQIISTDINQHNFIINHVISKNEINNSVYEQILSSLHAQISNPSNLANVESDKIELLVKDKMLVLSKESLEFINQMHPELLGAFIKRWKTDFDHIMQEQPIIISEEAILDLLDSNDFTDEDKAIFIKHTDKSVSISLMKYINHKDIVQCAILKDHLDNRELPDIIKNYNSLHKPVQSLTLKYFPQFPDTFTSEHALNNLTLVQDICHSEDIDISQKIKIVINLIPLKSKDFISELLNEIDSTEYGNILIKGRLKSIRISQTQTNDLLFKTLEQAGMIKSWSKQSNFGYNVVRNNK